MNVCARCGQEWEGTVHNCAMGIHKPSMPYMSGPYTDEDAERSALWAAGLKDTALELQRLRIAEKELRAMLDEAAAALRGVLQAIGSVWDRAEAVLAKIEELGGGNDRTS